jgi:hypothetical protein
MDKRNASTQEKIQYSPIEAAIRWSGLFPQETFILQDIDHYGVLNGVHLSKWPSLQLNFDRIVDALVNHELPYCRNGVICTDAYSSDDLNITIRHVALKTWMKHYYPDQKPEFLFDPVEQMVHPAISVDFVQTLIAERDIFKAQYHRSLRSYEELQAQYVTLDKKHAKLASVHPPSRSVNPRSESTYQHIIGGLLGLLLGESPGGQRYSSFNTLDSVISALITHHAGVAGITERTLWSKFSEARRSLTPEL